MRKILIETTKVSNKDKGDYYDAYIGRGTPWGNPFPIRENGDDRNEVIEKYRTYFNEKITNDEDFRKGIKSLKGKVLGCHCKPLPCHGDIISNYLNSLDEDE
nr:DUF4326 domain-containing protein [Chromobacterium sp. ASV23]